MYSESMSSMISGHISVPTPIARKEINCMTAGETGQLMSAGRINESGAVQYIHPRLVTQL